MNYVDLKDTKGVVAAPIRQIINKNEVKLYDEEWVILKIGQACPLIEKWKIEKLLIYNHSFRDIFKEISQIQILPNLLFLYISLNSIESIEGLNKINMPKLIELDLCRNKINSIKELRKVSLINLKELWVRQTIVKQTSFKSYRRYTYLQQRPQTFKRFMDLPNKSVIQVKQQSFRHQKSIQYGLEMIEELDKQNYRSALENFK